MTMKIGILLIVLCSSKLQRCSHDTLTLIAGGQKKDKRADTVYFKDSALNQFDRLFLNLGETKIVQLRNRHGGMVTSNLLNCGILNLCLL